MNSQHIGVNVHQSRPFDGTVNFLAEVWQQALGLVDLFMQCQQRTHDRAILRDLSEHQLRDLGLTRGDVMVEVDKPFWRA